jgi:hypothetical protein
MNTTIVVAVVVVACAALSFAQMRCTCEQVCRGDTKQWPDLCTYDCIDDCEDACHGELLLLCYYKSAQLQQRFISKDTIVS